MRKIFIYVNILFFYCTTLFAPANVQKILAQKLNQSVKNVIFKYKDANLGRVINEIATKKNVNVVFPAGENPIPQKLTISIDEKLSVSEAWDFLQTILDIAGYAMVPQEENKFLVVKVGENIAREPFKIYVSTPYNEIPNTDERIIYLMYFSNIQVKEGNSVVSKILGEGDSGLLAPGSKFKLIPDAKGVMIIAKANNLRTIVKILNELDKVGFKENAEIIKLRYASASTVATLINSKFFDQTQDRRNIYRRARKKSEAHFFEQGTKVVAEPRTNSIIIIGRPQAIDRLKEFIHQYIDVPIGSGRSILHRKVLQYLDAETFAQDLSNIVGAAKQEDSQSRGAQAGYGPERFFKGVIIAHDKPELKEGEDQEKGKYQYSGTNSLIIAATHDDWIRINRLIGELDRPQPQVIIEVLIVDLTIDENKLLGASIRNPDGLPIFRLSNNDQSLNAQAGQIGAADATNAIVTDPALAQDSSSGTWYATTPDTTLAGDLMNSADNPYFGSQRTGDTFISLSDKNGDVWSVLKMLSLYEHIKVLSHPYLVAINNKPAVVTVGEQRVVEGAGSLSAGNTVVQKWDQLDANLTVTLTPRIGGSDTVNLQVGINIDQFTVEATAATEANAGDRNNRQILTNANIKSGDILALGGLIRIDIVESRRATPILGDIPIFGWLFKRKSMERKKVNLTVFIRPTIIMPSFRAGINKYTKDYINVAKAFVDQGMLFDTLRDPITRWFFKVDEDAREMADIFIEEVGGGSRIEQKPKESLDELVRQDDLDLVDSMPKDKKSNAEKTKVTENKKYDSREGTLKDMLTNEDNPLLQARSIG